MRNDFPAWFYGPNGQSQICQSEADVPEGWQDHPSKVITPERTGSAPLPPQTDQLSEGQRGAGPVNPGDQGGNNGGKPAPGSTGDVSNTLDAHGWPWSAEMHASTQAKTKAGLWRMKVGVSRPAPKPGFPKPLLDL
jgi:hypothetical protein